MKYSGWLAAITALGLPAFAGAANAPRGEADYLTYPPEQKPEISVRAVDCSHAFDLGPVSFAKWQAEGQSSSITRGIRDTSTREAKIVFDLKLPRTAIVNIEYSLSLLWQERNNPRRKIVTGKAQFIGATGELPVIYHVHEAFYRVDNVTINRMDCRAIAVKVPEPPPCPSCEAQTPPKTEDEKVMDAIKNEEFMKRFIEQGK